MKLFKKKFKTHLKMMDAKPTIMTGIAVTGVIFTAITAIHDTPKAMKILKHEEDDRRFQVKVNANFHDQTYELEDLDVPISTIDKIKLTWKCYIPTIVVTLATCACVIKANKLNKAQQKQLLAAYAILSTSYNEYRDKVKDIFGDNAGMIDNFVAEDHAKYDKPVGANAAPDAKTVIFVDSFMNTVFESTVEDVQAAEYHLNRNFALRGYTSMGEFYRMLGLDDIYADDGPTLERFGWSYDMGTDMGYEWIDFEHEKIEEEGQPLTYIIKYPFEPVLGYMM